MTQAPAGWYPQQDGQLRYWDGNAWTQHFAPAAAGSGEGSRTGALSRLASALTTESTTQWGSETDTIWRAEGRPLTGLGAGRYRLTSHYLFFERGLLSTDSQQVPVAAVVDVDVRQSVTQKARGVGTVLVHVQRAGGVEVVVMADIPDPLAAQRVLNETAHAARVAVQRHSNTHRYETVSHERRQPTTEASTQAPTSPGPLEQLRQLGELRDAGILTEEEFTAKKADILGRL